MVTEAIGLYDHLRPFRRRLRLLLAWRWGALGGLGGIGVAIGLELLDWWNQLLLVPWYLLLPIEVGLLLGIAFALVRPLPPQAVAVMIDRRGNLKDRVQTALERAQAEGVFTQPLIEDALEQMERMRPAQLFRLKWDAWQSAFIGALALLIILHYLPFLPFLQSEQKKREQQEVKAISKQVEQVAKPILERAEKPDADELEKRIARNVELFRKRAQQGRMSKKEAMLKVNQLLAQSRQLEQRNQRRLEQVTLKASTAAEQLKQAIEKRKQLDSEMKQLLLRMQELQAQLRSGKDSQGRSLTPEQIASLQNELQALQSTLQALQNPSNSAMTEAQMQSLQQQMEALQRQLQSGKDNNGIPLSKEALEALKQQLQRLQQQMRALRLSEEAREFLRKLMNDPNFIEAMKRLQELAKKCQSCNIQQRKLTWEEIERLAKELEKRLEELARKYKSDEQIRELAKQLLEQVKQMKKYAQIGGAYQGMMGLYLGLPMTAMGQGGAWDKSEWFGQPEMFNQGAKQPRLKIPMRGTPVRGQQPLLPGPAEYMEYKAPPTPGESSVPLSRVLPAYQKSAENALNKQEVPPAERKRVKRYFDSLRSAQ